MFISLFNIICHIKMRISAAVLYTIPRITAANIHFSYEITKIKLHFSYKGNKKAANRKGPAAHDRSDSYFFYGLSFLYILISMDLYFLQYGFQSSDEVIDILLGQYQWREDTENVGASATGETVLLVDELAANFLVRNVEYGSYH